jgi:subfamily B ATP-binding cassette protein MsbA
VAEIRRLFGYVRPYLGRMILAAILLGVAGALMSAMIATIKPLMNEVLVPGATPASPDPPPPSLGPDVLGAVQRALPLRLWSAWLRERAFVQVPLLIMVIFVFRATFLYFGQYLMTQAGVSVLRDLRADLFASVAHQSQRFFLGHPTGTILSRILGDVQQVQRVMTTVLSDFVRVSVMVPFLLVLVLVHDWKMSLIALVALPLLAFPMVRLGRRLRRASTRSQESMAEAAGRLTEAVTGVKVVQGFGGESFEIGRFRQALDRLLAADLKAARATALSPAVMEVVGAVAGAVLFYAAGVRIHRGTLTGGDFLLILTGLGLLYMSVRRLNQLNVELQHALAASTRVFAMMDRERDIRDAPGARPLPPFRDAIVLESVVFAYEDERVLDGVDLTVRRGEMVALVGSSGSGKSTLANLVLRFYDPTEGAIRIDGHDLRQVTLASLRGQIGLVTQETVLFDDSVRRNIAYGRAEADQDRIVDAARAAHAHEFIERLPRAYDTELGERGARLSMGQRQRITIARALLKDPPILILDEATSALDSESEALVQQALERLMAGRTSLVIAHRLSTVRRADRIVVLERGRIVEQGTHHQLLAQGGLYARLHDLQFRESAT